METDPVGTALTRRTAMRLAASIAAVGIAGCSAATEGTIAAAESFNPAVWNFAEEIGKGILAADLYDIAKSIQSRAGSWSAQQLQALLEQVPADRCYGEQGYSLTLDGVRLLLISVTSGPYQNKKCPVTNPLTDSILVAIQPSEYVHLPAWAWQTLLSFNHEYLGDSTGRDLEVRKALLRIALAPVAPRVSSFDSKLEVTGSVAYRTLVGWVDIGRAKESDGSYTGHIEVSCVPDSMGKSFVGVYPLPTKVAT